MNQNRQDDPEGQESGGAAPKRPGEFVWDWQAKAALAVCASLAAAFALLPEILRQIGLEHLKALPSPVLMALETLPLQGALLLSVAVPAALPSARGAMGRLWIRASSLRQILFVLGIEALLFPALLVLSLACKFAAELLKLGADTQQLVVKQALETGAGGFAVLFASAVILAPIAEELAFRRALFGFLQGFAGTFPAFVTSSAIFAASHCSLAQFPSLFALGLALQWTCLRWKSLTPAILLHSLHNAISMGALLAMRLFGIHASNL